MEIHLKEAGDHEIHIVHSVMRRAFEEFRDQLNPPSGALSETVEDIQRKINKNGGALLVWQGDVPIGSAQFYFRDSYIYLGRMSVLPEFRGYRLGRMMIAYIEELARSKGYREARLEVRLSVPKNVEFYKRQNYEVLEERQYPNHTDQWYVMRKDL